MFMPAHQWLAEWSRWWWPALINHVWQASLFALAAWLVAYALRRTSAQIRHAIWSLAFAKFLLPSAILLLAFEWSGLGRFWRPPNADSAQPTQVALSLQPVQPVTVSEEFLAKLTVPASFYAASEPQHQELYCVLSLLWLSGVASLVSFWRLQYRRIARTVRAGRVVETGRERETLNRAQARLLCRREVSLISAPREAALGVWGIRRP